MWLYTRGLTYSIVCLKCYPRGIEIIYLFPRFCCALEVEVRNPLIQGDDPRQQKGTTHRLGHIVLEVDPGPSVGQEDGL